MHERLVDPRHEQHVAEAGVKHRRAGKEAVSVPLVNEQETYFVSDSGGLAIKLGFSLPKGFPRQVRPSKRGQEKSFHSCRPRLGGV
jgi:hypothetical protein